ncbi:MAG: VOC family protein [Syntrophobacterales bacterium]|jgi:methylmalonyl-CoA/ethylmalonyl-CoA epimerase|nr:VOC family protein [Syntrophobacterales bacterium]
MAAPILRIDHISIAVHDRQKAEYFFRSILGAIPGTASIDPFMKYSWEILSLGDLSRVEILCPTSEGSFLDGFLEKREGVHHMTLQTSDIEETKTLLRHHNIPYFGDNEYGDVLWKEIFIHPRHAFGVLIQIAEFHPADWLSDQAKIPGSRPWEVKQTDEGVQVELAHPGGGKMTLNLTPEEARRLAQELMGR